MPRGGVVSNPKYSSITQFLLHSEEASSKKPNVLHKQPEALGQNLTASHNTKPSSALGRWLHESPQQEAWNGFSHLQQSHTSDNLGDKEVIQPGDLRILAQRVYDALYDNE
jgi:hypothetical protein